ncbi:MAG: hypothetical protein HUU50_22660 [Candidatus Brocadiae bacterium]|nr:hypothetical protein [Candidatus Brocadiia bacterium]
MKYTIFLLCLVLVLGMTGTNAGTVTLVNLSNFLAPATQDFEAASDGNISSTSSLFQNIGITSVTASTSATSNTDIYDCYFNGRALNYDGQLFLISNTSRTYLTGAPLTFRFNLADYRQRIGFRITDYNTAITANFYNNTTLVGTYTTSNLNSVAGSSGTDFLGFQNSDIFNRVDLVGSTDAYGIGLITIDATVPEASSLLMFSLCILGILVLRKK